MSGFYRAEANWWPDTADALQQAGVAWPWRSIMQDLRWWADQERQGHRCRPGRRLLAKRWNVPDRTARKALAAVAEWWDPHWGEPPAIVERQGPGAEEAVPLVSRSCPAGVPDEHGKVAETQEAVSRSCPASVPLVSSRAYSTDHRTQDTGLELPQTPSPDGEGATLPEPDHGWERLPARTRTALTEADVHSLPQLAALTEEQVRAIPGVGSKARRQLRAALQAAGLDYAPEPEPEVDLSQRRQNRAERACSDIFAEAWRRRFDTPYAWDLAANGRDRDRRRRLVAIARLDPESQADRDRLGKAVLAYLADHAAGRAWPKDEPPSFRRFVDRAGDYLSGAVPLPTAGPATDAAATAWARVLSEVQAHGRNACEQAPPPVLHALAAVGGAHRLAGMTAFDLGRLWPAFRDAYHRGAA